jgi:pantoate--beta-alanine ligase
MASTTLAALKYKVSIRPVRRWRVTNLLDLRTKNMILPKHGDDQRHGTIDRTFVVAPRMESQKRMSQAPILLKSIEEAREWSRQARKGGTLGFVPTMGALHTGHAELIRAAARECDQVVVSIYVNPTQFGANEDLGKYPRTFEADLALCRSIGVSAVFAPTDEIMYPHGKESITIVHVPELTDVLEGETRPGHFDGVATVVTKLFGIVMPDAAYFGRKDYQQWLVIRRMTEDLDLPVRLVRVDTVREPDGLAMSSRNRYLNAEERLTALALSQALRAAQVAVQRGTTLTEELETCMRDSVELHPGLQLDYAFVRSADNLKKIERVDKSSPDSAVALIAARVGTTRLIDNVLLPPEPGALIRP